MFENVLEFSYRRYFKIILLDSIVSMNHTPLETHMLVFQSLFCIRYIIFISCCKLVLRASRERGKVPVHTIRSLPVKENSKMGQLGAVFIWRHTVLYFALFKKKKNIFI